MPIQSYFEADIGGAFPQAPQKTKDSPGKGINFLFKEYIQEDASWAPPPGLKESLKETQGKSQEEALDIDASLVAASFVSIEAILPKESLEEGGALAWDVLDPDQPLTMKQLDLALKEDAPENKIQLPPLKKEVQVEKFIQALERPLEESAFKREAPPLPQVDFSQEPPLPLNDLEPASDVSFLKEQKEAKAETSVLFEDTPPEGRGESREALPPSKPSVETAPPLSAPLRQDFLGGGIDAVPPKTLSIPDITTQVLDQMPRELFSTQGNHQVKIQLYPEELGQVTIDLKIDDKKQIQALFSATQGGTIDLLRQDSAQLLQALKNEGFDVGAENFQFSSDAEKPRDQTPKAHPFLPDKTTPSSFYERQEKRALSSKLIENNLIDIRVH